MLARMAPLVDHWHFTDLPTPRAAQRRASCCARWQRRADARRDVPASDARQPRGRARRGDRAARTPLIESSSSDRSTPWAACSSTDCRSAPAATPPERSGSTLAGSPRLRIRLERPASMFKQKRDRRSPTRPARARRRRAQARTRARQRLIGAVVLVAGRHHRLPAGLRDPAAADPGRHPDRDPATATRCRRWRCRRRARRRRAGAGDAPAASRPRAPAAPRRRPPRRRSARRRRRRGGERSPSRAPMPAAKRSRRAPAAPSRAAPQPRSRKAAGVEPARRAAAAPRAAAARAARAATTASAPARCSKAARPPAPTTARFVVQVGAFADAERRARRARRSRSSA